MIRVFQKIKNKRKPYFSFQQRVKVLSEIKSVDYIVKMDEKKSLEYYKKAADLGHSNAQVSYADHYFKKNLKHSSTKDEDEICLKYLKMAAKQIHPEAFLKLGLYYFTIQEDPVEGLAWLYLANNFFCNKPDRLEYFWNRASPEEIKKAEKRSDQIIKDLLQKNKTK